MLRNREVRLLIVACLAIMAAGSAGALIELSEWAAVRWVLLSSGGVTVAALVFTAWRYKRLAEMAEQVDEILHGARDVSFKRMREGELAILASELDKMTSRLILAAEDLAAEKNALADSLADISHQLKTPMTSLNLITVLVRDSLVDFGGHSYEVSRLREMERLEERIQWLVSSLLKLARLDAGTVSFAQEPVNAERLVRRAAAPLAVAFDLADVQLQVDADPEASFEGDGAWTAEALENILKNCMEHTPPGGTVTVIAAEDALACRIRVRDTGPGIAEKDLPHVFERFYRGDAKVGEPSEDPSAGSEVNPHGVGIGLALAQSLVTAQGGSIRAGNAYDNAGNVTGATFEIAFFKATV